MSEEVRKIESPHFNLSPFLGLELGERWGRELGELSQRLTGLEDSVDKLDAKLDAAVAKFETKLDARDAKFEAKLDALDAKFEARFDAQDAKFEARFDALDAKFETKLGDLDAKFETRFDGLESKFEAKLDAQDAKIDKIARALHRLDERLTSNARVTWGLFGAILVTIIAQKLL